jgi:hypothetical protein
MRSARAIPLLSEDRSHVDIPVQPTTHLAPTCRRAPTRPHGHPPRRRHHQPPQPRQSGRELVTTRRQRTHSTHETSALTSRSRSSDYVAVRGIGSGPRCRDSRCSPDRNTLAMKSSVRSRSAALSIGRHTRTSKPVWTGAFRPIVMQHGSSSIAESRRAADGMESIAARRRIDVLWALLRDNRTWARHHRRSLKRLDNPQ